MVATAIIGGAVIGGVATHQSAKKGASASKRAAETSAASQREGLAYLQEVERLPRAFREGALIGLGEEYGLTLDEQGNVISDDTTIAERALASPFYTTGVERAEDAILRNAAATGGLRSGNVQDALARANQDLFLQSYQNQLTGLQGLGAQPSYASKIAGVQTGIGQTQAAGLLGAAQARQQGYQGVGDAITGGINNYLLASQAGLI